MTARDTWFFVADRSRVLVYRPDEEGGLHKVHDFDEPAVREHAIAIMTDRPGRRADSAGRGGPRSAMDRRSTPQETEVQHFVDTLADWLHTAATRGAFGQLVIVAAPQMLGELRGKLSKPVTEKLVGTLDKGFAKRPPHELAKTLHEHFPDQMAERKADVPEAARKGNQQPPA